jgi:hypothetical protein
MPDLNSPLHLDMLKRSRVRQSRLSRGLKAARREWTHRHVYGMEWGDPDSIPPLAHIRQRFVDPYVAKGGTAIEIGPGGGRWTQYLCRMERVYAVDYHRELLDELQKTFRRPNIVPIANHGTDFPGVPAACADFVFSFGVFVHLDVPLIEGYLANFHEVIKPTTNLVIQYSDKTKVMAQMNPGFSHNDPVRMRKMVEGAGYEIVEEDTTSLWHSSVMRFVPRA